MTQALHLEWRQYNFKKNEFQVLKRINLLRPDS